MADEPEVQSTGVEPTGPDATEAVAAAEEILTSSEQLEQAQLQETLALNGYEDDEDLGDDEDDADTDEALVAEAPPLPPTTAEKKKLADLIADDPDLAAEYAQLTSQQAQLEARQIAQQQAQQAQFQALEQDYKRKGAAYAQERNGRDAIRAQLDAYGQQDVIAAQELREQWNGYWAQQDQEWASTHDTYTRQTQTWQATTRAQQAEQRAAQMGFQRLFDELPADLKAMVPHDKNYNGTFADFVYQYQKDWKDALIAYGRQVERDEARAKATERRAARVANATQQLAQEAPEISVGGRAARPSLPTMDEIDSWSYEKKMDELAKDPHLYDKVAAAEPVGGRRRR